jgi:Ca2+:H+ antiporter
MELTIGPQPPYLCFSSLANDSGVSVGSSIQIAAGMIPLLVLIAWPMGKNLTLFFVSFLIRTGCVAKLTKKANFETITLFVSVMLVNLLLQDGKSNYMEGLMCMCLSFCPA